jgi:hypothetical protein
VRGPRPPLFIKLFCAWCFTFFEGNFLKKLYRILSCLFKALFLCGDVWLMHHLPMTMMIMRYFACQFARSTFALQTLSLSVFNIFFMQTCISCIMAVCELLTKTPEVFPVIESTLLPLVSDEIQSIIMPASPYVFVCVPCRSCGL